MTTRSALPALATVALAFQATAGAASLRIRPAVLEGQMVEGVGRVTTIDNLAVNNSGHWIVEADTDHADTDADSVLIRGGELYLREGDPLEDPNGAWIDSFDSINISNPGNSGWNFFLGGTGGTNDDSGIYFNTDLVIQEGTISGAPEFSPGTPYLGFFEVQINDHDELLAMSSVDDPNIPTTVDRAIVFLTPDPLTERVIAKEGDQLGGQTELVTDFGTGPHAYAFNNARQSMFVADLTGDTTRDGVVYIDQTLIAQEGSPSPIEGRDWATLSTSVRLDLNNSGGYAHTGRLAGDPNSDDVIVSHLGKVVQEGDRIVTDSGEFVLTGFGTGPVRIDDSGNVFWFGDWNDPNLAVDTGLFRNGRLIVQEGVTTVDGVVLERLAIGVQDGFSISDDGRYVIFEGTLVGGIDGAFLGTVCFEDVNGDGVISQGDLAQLLAAFGTCRGQEGYDPEADINSDGCVGQADLAALLAVYGENCP